MWKEIGSGRSAEAFVRTMRKHHTMLVAFTAGMLAVAFALCLCRRWLGLGGAHHIEDGSGETFEIRVRRVSGGYISLDDSQLLSLVPGHEPHGAVPVVHGVEMAGGDDIEAGKTSEQKQREEAETAEEELARKKNEELRLRKEKEAAERKELREKMKRQEEERNKRDAGLKEEAKARSRVIANAVDQMSLDRPIAAQLSELMRREGARVRDLFTEWDQDGSGTVDHDEFHRALMLLGLKTERKASDALFATLDPDGSGSIEYNELESVTQGDAQGRAPRPASARGARNCDAASTRSASSTPRGQRACRRRRSFLSARRQPAPPQHQMPPASPPMLPRLQPSSRGMEPILRRLRTRGARAGVSQRDSALRPRARAVKPTAP